MSVSSSNEGLGPSPPGHQEPRVSCMTCKKRKVKCDKNFPCANCARRQIDCVYLTAGKRRTRGPGKHRAGERIEQMTNRVAQLEQALGKLQSKNIGEDQFCGPDNHREVSEPMSVEEHGSQGGRRTKSKTAGIGDGEEDGINSSASRLLVKGGKTQYIRNKFWATINNEVRVLPRSRAETDLTRSLKTRKTCLKRRHMLLRVKVMTTNFPLAWLLPTAFFLVPWAAPSI
jgi:hypothetical protein